MKIFVLRILVCRAKGSLPQVACADSEFNKIFINTPINHLQNLMPFQFFTDFSIFIAIYMLINLRGQNILQQVVIYIIGIYSSGSRKSVIKESSSSFDSRDFKMETQWEDTKFELVKIVEKSLFFLICETFLRENLFFPSIFIC